MLNPIHIGYCTNIHPGESWDETFENLKTHVVAVRDGLREDPVTAAAFCDPYPIGLRLSAEACATLRSQPSALSEFRDWCAEEDMLIYTVNGFPYGQFHNSSVKERVYLPDWSAQDRLDYTIDLFRVLLDLTPDADHPLTVSTVPGSFKRFIHEDPNPENRLEAIRSNLRTAAATLESLANESGRDLILGLEPEPLGLIENAEDTVELFDFLTNGLDTKEREQFLRRIGITLDTCHAAVEYDDVGAMLDLLLSKGIRIAKIHLSNAIRLNPQEPDALERIANFAEPTYLHQVIAANRDGSLTRYADLPDALAAGPNGALEWRVHFHIPLYAAPQPPLSNTIATLADTALWLRDNPDLVSHFEMETYTFDVMPESLRPESVTEMLINEHHWCAKAFLAQALDQADDEV